MYPNLLKLIPDRELEVLLFSNEERSFELEKFGFNGKVFTFRGSYLVGPDSCFCLQLYAHVGGVSDYHMDYFIHEVSDEYNDRQFKKKLEKVINE